MVTITVCTQKGGVGKTTTATTIAAGIARKGYKVLAIDLDPQHNLTAVSAAVMIPYTIADVLNGRPTAEAIRNTAQGFDLLPGSLELSTAPEGYSLDGLRGVIEDIQGVYDYCVIDTPPALSILTMSALAVSDSVIIPAHADTLSLYGLDQIQETIEAVRPYNEGLCIAGVLLTEYNPRRNVQKTMRDTIEAKAQDMGAHVFNTTIRSGTAVQEAQLLRQDLFAYAPRAAVTLDYEEFIKELLKGAK